MLKEKMAALWAKAVDNKELLIKVGLTLAGVAVGAITTSIVANIQERNILEELLMVQDEEEDEDEDSS